MWGSVLGTLGSGIEDVLKVWPPITTLSRHLNVSGEWELVHAEGLGVQVGPDRSLQLVRVGGPFLNIFGGPAFAMDNPLGPRTRVLACMQMHMPQE